MVDYIVKQPCGDCGQMITFKEKHTYMDCLNYKKGKNVIDCPICEFKLEGKFTPKIKGIGMARLYWYCFNCKLSVNQSIRKAEEHIYKNAYQKRK